MRILIFRISTFGILLFQILGILIFWDFNIWDYGIWSCFSRFWLSLAKETQLSAVRDHRVDPVLEVENALEDIIRSTVKVGI
jgi:hypothetical protein